MRILKFNQLGKFGVRSTIRVDEPHVSESFRLSLCLSFSLPPHHIPPPTFSVPSDHFAPPLWWACFTFVIHYSPFKHSSKVESDSVAFYLFIFVFSLFVLILQYVCLFGILEEGRERNGKGGMKRKEIEMRVFSLHSVWFARFEKKGNSHPMYNSLFSLIFFQFGRKGKLWVQWKIIPSIFLSLQSNQEKIFLSHPFFPFFPSSL